MGAVRCRWRCPPGITAQTPEERRRAYHLTAAQYCRWRKLLAQPAAEWPATLQRRVHIAVEREGRIVEAVKWAIADYLRKAVPKRDA